MTDAPTPTVAGPTVVIEMSMSLDGARVHLAQARVVEGRGVVHLFYEVVDRLPR